MFDTVHVGKKIAELRKKNNMTQLELADALAISFQAVSNWERGNSMPDISKLPELSELFHVSIDELLGKNNPVVSKLIEESYEDMGGYSKDILVEAATIAKPEQVEKIAESVNFEINSISPLLPFLSEEFVDELAEQLVANGENITTLLPFMSDEKIDAVAEQLVANGEDINKLLPFMSDEALLTCANKALEQGGIGALSPYLPFLDEEDVNSFVKRFLKNK
ncbi:MAG: helix-turn-helix domain-containing protein [Clostridia bacterium]|nr:helix-turn-helix domain-containing protein [Clostridia bacterium]